MKSVNVNSTRSPFTKVNICLTVSVPLRLRICSSVCFVCLSVMPVVRKLFAERRTFAYVAAIDGRCVELYVLWHWSMPNKLSC